MKSMKLMLPALLLSISLGAFAQDDELSLEATSEEEATEVFVPNHPWEKPIFYRVQLGYIGTSAKYTNNNPKPTILGDESYFLSGVSLGLLSDIVLAKKIPFYIELGASFNYQTGTFDGNSVLSTTQEKEWHSRVNSFSMTIPVNLSYQFRNFRGIDGLTLAPFAGVYARFNFVADRSEDLTTSYYHTDNNGNKVLSEVQVKSATKSLMKTDKNNGWTSEKPHVGKLAQFGAQVGVNAFYKRYSFGLSYMYEFVPFAQHSSKEGITYKEKDAGGRDNIPGTGCDMEISTKHNFAVTVGYTF